MLGESGRRAQVIQTAIGVKAAWYYLLENPDGSLQVLDWRENSKAYGPYADMGTAFTYMQQHVNKLNRKMPPKVEVLFYDTAVIWDPAVRAAIDKAEENENELWGDRALGMRFMRELGTL